MSFAGVWGVVRVRAGSCGPVVVAVRLRPVGWRLRHWRGPLCWCGAYWWLPMLAIWLLAGRLSAMSSAVTLFRNGRVFSSAAPGASALLVRDGLVAWLGADADAPAADEVVDMAGGWVGPAFVDAHVHMTATGLVLTGLDLSGVASAGELLDAVAVFAAVLPPDAVVLGHGWDESGWPAELRTLPCAAELDRAAAGRRVYLSQASVHAALVSSALLAAVPAGTAGFDASGWLRTDAHHVVRELALGSLSSAQRDAAQAAALRHAASRGIAAVHECAGPVISSESDLLALLARSGRGAPEVYGYWGEWGAAVKARELGAVGAGGDLFVDGAFGSSTAWLSRPYAGGVECGHGYLDAAQVAEHVLGCVAAGVQAGFHAIGDAAIGAVLAGLRAAAEVVGVERIRAGRHRVEHAELLDRALIAGFVEFGLVASVQPMFDRWWGGPDGMYAARLGPQRALAANPLQTLHGVGVGLAFGSDAPVTPLDPWGAVAAAVGHHSAVQRMGVRSAFAAHTRGGWRALGPVADAATRQLREREGVLAPGSPATFAVWSTPAGVDGELPRVIDGAGASVELPVCERTVLRGETIFAAGTSVQDGDLR